MITQDLLRELFDYVPETGQLFRKITNKKGRGVKGDSVGSLTENGYLRTSINRQRHQVHRIIWCWVTGEWPEKGMVIDHINGNRSDNRWNNLRLCTAKQNAFNRKKARNSRTGFTGVYKDRRTGRFFVKISGKYVGTYETLNLAIAARKAYERAIFE